MQTKTTPAEDNKLHGLSPASRNEGPDNHKDNSKHMGKVYPDTTNSDNAENKENKNKETGNEGTTGDDNEDNA